MPQVILNISIYCEISCVLLRQSRSSLALVLYFSPRAIVFSPDRIPMVWPPPATKLCPNVANLWNVQNKKIIRKRYKNIFISSTDNFNGNNGERYEIYTIITYLLYSITSIIVNIKILDRYWIFHLGIIPTGSAVWWLQTHKINNYKIFQGTLSSDYFCFLVVCRFCYFAF